MLKGSGPITLEAVCPDAAVGHRTRTPAWRSHARDASARRPTQFEGAQRADHNGRSNLCASPTRNHRCRSGARCQAQRQPSLVWRLLRRCGQSSGQAARLQTAQYIAWRCEPRCRRKFCRPSWRPPKHNPAECDANCPVVQHRSAVLRLRQSGVFAISQDRRSVVLSTVQCPAGRRRRFHLYLAYLAFFFNHACISAISFF